MPQLAWLGDAHAASAGRCVFAMVTHAKLAEMSVGAQFRKAIGL
jgi:hypothetical protein